MSTIYTDLKNFVAEAETRDIYTHYDSKNLQMESYILRMRTKGELPIGQIMTYLEGCGNNLSLRTYSNTGLLGEELDANGLPIFQPFTPLSKLIGEDWFDSREVRMTHRELISKVHNRYLFP